MPGAGPGGLCGRDHRGDGLAQRGGLRCPAGDETPRPRDGAHTRSSREPGLERAAPEGADILGWRLEGSELKLEVSPEWAELSGFEKTVAECCAALSFCALEGVERVSFYLLGQRLGRSIDEGDIILSAYAEEE